MSKTTVDGKLTISRVYGSQDYVEITLRDCDAVIDFAKVRISVENFGEAVLGLSCMECEIITRGLQNVGKVRESKHIEFPIGKDNYMDRKKVASEIVKDYTPEGWTASTYFGSQNSFFTRGDVCWARTSITRWVDKEDGD